MPHATCPTDPRHEEFITTAHVMQEWLVDNEGNFRSEVSTLETTHDPDSGNIWTCNTCGAQATVSD